MQIRLLGDKETVKDFLQTCLSIHSLRIGRFGIFLNPFRNDNPIAQGTTACQMGLDSGIGAATLTIA
jgi:hypothetical protein